MIKDCKILIELHHMHMVQVLESMQNRAKKLSKYKMINLDDVTNESKTEHNPKWPYILDHPYRILIIGGFGSGKNNAWLKLINQQDKDDYEIIDIRFICM